MRKITRCRGCGEGGGEVRVRGIVDVGIGEGLGDEAGGGRGDCGGRGMLVVESGGG